MASSTAAARARDALATAQEALAKQLRSPEHAAEPT